MEGNITREDLELFRIQLLDDLKRLLDNNKGYEEKVEWLKSKEVRKMLTASPGTLQNLRIDGKLNPVKISGTWYYNKKEVELLFHNRN